MWNIVQFIIAFGVLLFFHEFGHFIAARLFKIEVEEFGFGLPPRIVKLFTWKGTDITLNWIPFGAFVRPKGENDPEIKGGMGAASPWVKLGVLFAGPLMNLAVGFILLVGLYGYMGVPDPAVVQVVQVAEDSPAQKAGLVPGDIVKQVNQTTIDNFDVLQSTIKASLDQQVTVVVERGGQQITLQMVPRANPPEGQGALGIQLDYGLKVVSWDVAVPKAAQGVYEQARQLVLLPANLIAGTISPDQARPVSIIGIGDLYNQAAQADAQASSTPVPRPPIYRLAFIIAITIALGLTNLLPIPGLDGGRILLTLPELILKRRIPTQYENTANAIGILLLLFLMVVITISDIIHLVKPS
jgi:regulator of sigma E protease